MIFILLSTNSRWDILVCNWTTSPKRFAKPESQELFTQGCHDIYFCKTFYQYLHLGNRSGWFHCWLNIIKEQLHSLAREITNCPKQAGSVVTMIQLPFEPLHCRLQHTVWWFASPGWQELRKRAWQKVWTRTKILSPS